MAGQLDKVLGATEGPKPGTLVTQHFAAVDALVTGTPPPIDGLLSLMGQAQQQLKAAGGLGGQPGSPAVLSAIQNALGALQSAAGQMPRWSAAWSGLEWPVAERCDGCGAQRAGKSLSDPGRRQCRELVGNRYPFLASSGSDVTLEDFGRVFGTGGIYDTFFQANLAPLVDISHPVWRWKEGADAVGGSAAMLAQFQGAERIRKVFFKPGARHRRLGSTSRPTTSTRTSTDSDWSSTDRRSNTGTVHRGRSA